MKNRISKIIAIFVGIFGLAVMFGWIFDITILKSVLPQLVTMKFVAAFGFLLSGFILYFSANHLKIGRDWKELALIFASFTLLLIMTTLMLSIFFSIKTGLEDLFIQESADAIKTTARGMPSFLTVINFILVALFGVTRFFKNKIILRSAQLFGGLICATGIVAVIGYIVNMPVLYSYLADVSSAMALHTAILFVFLGAGFLFVHDQNNLSADK